MKNKWFDKHDKRITHWMQIHGIKYLRYSLALVFIWFGGLKPLGLSPAQTLVENTVYWFDPTWFVPLLGWWEVLIGICFLYKPLLRIAIGLMGLQMAGTLLPLILLPEVIYGTPWWVLTLEGQYIIKNIVLISAALVIGSHVRDRVKKK